MHIKLYMRIKCLNNKLLFVHITDKTPEVHSGGHDLVDNCTSWMKEEMM